MQTSRYNGIKVSVNSDNTVSFNHPDYPQYPLTAKYWEVGKNMGDKWQECKLKNNVKMFKPQLRLVVVVDMIKKEIVDAEHWDKYGDEYRYAQKSVEDRYII